MASEAPLLHNNETNGANDANKSNNANDILSIIINSPHKLQKCQDEVVDALGGVDSILRNYIDHDILNEHQLQTLRSILNSSSPSNSYIPQMTQSISHHLPTHGTIVFNESNTCIHHLFSIDRVKCILKWLYHRWMVTIAFVYCVIHAIAAVIEWFGYKGGYSFIVQPTVLSLFFLCDIWLSIYCILLILSGNVKALGFCLKSFEFWLKVFYALRVMIGSPIYEIFFRKSDNWIIVCRFGRYMLLVTITVLYSTIDALKWKSESKTAFGIVFALYVSVYAVFDTFIAEPYYIEFGGMSIDVLDIMASSNRVLSIFLWKQAILSTWKEGKAQIINTWVNIEWVNDNSKSPLSDSIE